LSTERTTGGTDDVPLSPLRTASVNGLAVSRRRPEEPLATVVFVHGAMDRAASFARVMRRLGEFDVVAYDRRGYGGSQFQDPPDAVSPSPAGDRDPLCYHALDLAAVVDWACAPHPRAPRVVVGHSLGALIALVAAATDCSPVSAGPLRTDALCVFEPPLPWLDAGRVTSGSRAIDVGHAEGPEASAEFFYRSMVGDRTWDRLGSTDRAARRSEGKALMAELVAARSARRSLPLPSELDIVHVGRGEHGPAHLRAAAETLATAAGVGCEVLVGASHGAHMQHPDRFALWVRAAALGTVGVGDAA
jgi:pimeloyl-ACP methyl ester carboxylesterase